MKRKCLYLVEKNKITLEERDWDASLQPTQVLVKSHCSVVSAGTETARFQGLDGDIFPNETGSLTIGEIMAVGLEVKDYQIGERVACLASHASVLKCETVPIYFGWNGQRVNARVPDGLSSQEAALSYPCVVSMAAIRLSDVRLGDEVLVIGAGLIGNTAAQLFQCAGASVILADLSENRLTLARECGILSVLQPGKDGIKLEDAVRKWSGGRSLQHVVFAIEGGAQLISSVIPLLGQYGNLVLHGAFRRSETIDAALFSQLGGRCGRIISTSAWGFPVLDDPRHIHSASIMAHFRQVLRLIADKKLHVQPLITIVRPEDCQQVFEDLIHKKEKYVGAVFDWTK